MRPLIEPRPDAPEGEVRTLPHYSANLFVPPCAVLCRNTAPLVAFAYGLLTHSVPCHIIGRDIGKGLVDLAKKLGGQDESEFLSRLSSWADKELIKAANDDRSPESIYDKHDAMRFFLDMVASNFSIESLCRKIESLFADGDQKNQVTLSTIHRAKGLEWPTVFLLDRHLLPSKYAKQLWQRLQERNLLYVAVTRSQYGLYYINSNCWKEESNGPI